MIGINQDGGDLAELMRPLAAHAGLNVSPLPGVTFQRITQPLARSPAIYRPSIKIVGQGSIRSHLGRDVFTYDAEHYLVVAAPLPVECEIEASLARPLLFMSLDLDWTTLGALLAETGRDVPGAAPLPRAVRAAPLTAELREATMRLLRGLRSASDTRVLGPALAREILYRVLQGEQGAVLRAAAARHGGFARIGQALQLIHRDYAKAPSVVRLARAAGMSVPAFHRNFKAVLATSPLRYLQTIRLHKARSLMAHEGLNVTGAARVGYESPSQFSREFRRLFGLSPTADAERAGSAQEKPVNESG